MRLSLSGPRIFGFRPGISFGPDELLRKPSPRRQSQGSGSFIYVISDNHGSIKVGISTNPTVRLAQLQRTSAAHLALAYVAALRCTGYAVEAEAHRTLASYRQGGEWFNCPVDMAVAAIGAAAYRLGEPIASGDPKLADEAVRMVAAVNDMATAPRPWHWLGIAAAAIVKGTAGIVLAGVAWFCFYIIAVTI
jgi:hypothetical protein